LYNLLGNKKKYVGLLKKRKTRINSLKLHQISEINLALTNVNKKFSQVNGLSQYFPFLFHLCITNLILLLIFIFKLVLICLFILLSIFLFYCAAFYLRKIELVRHTRENCQMNFYWCCIVCILISFLFSVMYCMNDFFWICLIMKYVRFMVPYWVVRVKLKFDFF